MSHFAVNINDLKCLQNKKNLSKPNMFKYVLFATILCYAYAAPGIVATGHIVETHHVVPVVKAVPVVHAAPVVHTVPVVKTLHPVVPVVRAHSIIVH
ncbi:A-kinase anchor protein 14-like [Cylas formicarius]|uniref:A-kinase anchor protein 14-like n=1 Tax=Cylas formicarius TaxID=197179 RepID=UPI00295897A0|nr:A-kinase anchor protein 14-like [Cylas formicarius]